MPRIRCHFYPSCPRTATRYTRNKDLCELHYAQVDTNRAHWAAMTARDDPPFRIVERQRLVEVLEEMLGETEVHSILWNEKWYQRLKEPKKE